MEDKLIVSGVHDDIDGEHPCDIMGMLSVGHPESLTNRELHRIKAMTGILAGNLMDAVFGDDMDATVALSAVILTRNGKVYLDDWLWDAPMGAGLTFKFREIKEEEEAPPAKGVPESTPTESVERSGGGSSEPASGLSQNVQSGTGSPPSATSAT